MFLSTGKIAFRQLEQEDLPQLRDWRNSLEIRNRTREFKPLNMLDQEKWFSSYANDNIMFAIESEKKLIGVCGLTHIDWKNRSTELSWYIGDGDFKKKGLGRRIIYLLCEYCFVEVGLHRFWGEVYVIDGGLIPMYEKLGFGIDGYVRDTYWWDGQWWPSAMISILDTEWKEIRESYLKGGLR
jgi:RimJ/RimL family protein N-acetyltransferase